MSDYKPNHIVTARDQIEDALNQVSAICNGSDVCDGKAGSLMFEGWTNAERRIDIAIDQIAAALENLKRHRAEERSDAREQWKPTHRVNGIPVMLCADKNGGGPAYTREEWDTTTAADYERQPDGSWTFEGRPFCGTVEKISD